VTLLVALRGDDGLVLAADSRGTFGDPSATTAQNDSMQKAHVLAPHVAALSAGSGEVASLLILEATKSVGVLDGVTPVMEHLRATARAKYNEWFPTVAAIQPPALLMTGQAPSRPGLSFLVAGYEMADGKSADPKVYQLISQNDFAPMLHDYGFAVAGVPQYALYLLNRLYERNRSVEELTALAVYVITETASQDGKVGGPVKVVTIGADDGCVALDEEAVLSVLGGNALRSQSLRDSFYEGS
jgi:20S proteasome alpha/beta subunit